MAGAYPTCTLDSSVTVILLFLRRPILFIFSLTFSYLFLLVHIFPCFPTFSSLFPAVREGREGRKLERKWKKGRQFEKFLEKSRTRLEDVRKTKDLATLQLALF